jgi:hypothetical protein
MTRATNAVAKPPWLAWRMKEAITLLSTARGRHVSQKEIASAISGDAIPAIVHQSTISNILRVGGGLSIDEAKLARIEEWLSELSIPPRPPESAVPVRAPHSAAAGIRSAPVAGLEPVHGDRQAAYVDALIRRVDRLEGVVTDAEMTLHSQIQRILRLNEE